MQQRQNGKQLIMIGGVLIALVLGVAFLFSHQGGGSNQASAQTTAPLLVAQQTIPQGTIFKAGQSLSSYFTVKQVPVSLVPFGAYTTLNQVQQLTQTNGCGPVKAAGCQGQVTSTQTIFQGTPVVTGMFSSLGTYRQGVSPAFAIPYGYVGIAVSFDAANSVVGSIFPGDDVDLIATYKGLKIPVLSQGGATQFTLNDLRVISVNGPPATSNSGSSSSSSSTSSTSANGASAQVPTGGTLVLLVRFQEALIIQHLKDVGEHWTISVVLRSARETDILHFKTLTVNDNWFFNKQSNAFKSNPGY